MAENTLSLEQLDQKEEELRTQFEKERQESIEIERQGKILEARFQEKVVNMTKLRGAFAVIQSLKKELGSNEPEAPLPDAE